MRHTGPCAPACPVLVPPGPAMRRSVPTLGPLLPAGRRDFGPIQSGHGLSARRRPGPPRNQGDRAMTGKFSVGLAAFALLGAAGCANKPGGPGYSDDTFTYYSLPHEPVTLSLMDTRTGQTVWTHEVPVGRELTVSFLEGTAPDNATS